MDERTKDLIAVMALSYLCSGDFYTLWGTYEEYGLTEQEMEEFVEENGALIRALAGAAKDILAQHVDEFLERRRMA